MFRYVVFCRFRVDAVLNMLVLDTRFLFLSLRPSLILGRLCQRPLQRVNVSRIRLTVNLIHLSMFSFSSHPPSLEFSSVVREGREGKGGGRLYYVCWNTRCSRGHALELGKYAEALATMHDCGMECVGTQTKSHCME